MYAPNCIFLPADMVTLPSLNSRDNVRHALATEGLLSFPSMELRGTGLELTPNVSTTHVTKWDAPSDGRPSCPSDD